MQLIHKRVAMKKKDCPCGSKAVLLRPLTRQLVCKSCFLHQFQNEVHQTIVRHKMFKPGETIAVGASGGKDSTALVHILNKLNREKEYGVSLQMLAIDEGIAGYRDDSLECVKRNQKSEDLPLTILSYKQLYGWTMDEVVSQIGQSHNCTYCGVFRRQALQRGAVLLKADKIAMGHNADDVAQTVLLNLLRGDYKRVAVSAGAITGEDEEAEAVAAMPRVRPFLGSFQKQIVLYAHHAKLQYFSTECKYSPFAFRGHARQFIKEVEEQDPLAILRMIETAQHLACHFSQKKAKPVKKSCVVCGLLTNSQKCKGCKLLAGLNENRPKKIKIRKEQVEPIRY